ncbi:MAG: hypothetical protein ACE5KA_07260 [Nitrososphaerales archaeon]
MIDSWCTVFIDGQQIRAKIVHKHTGKFQIVEAKDDRFVGKIVDASEVGSCKMSSFAA